jgi:glycosyltransferase involved in cell wall biosynthesis
VRRLNRADGRIQITGTVEDIRPFLHQATVAVAPVQYGAGIQNKVLESLACGTPVVATPEAVSGLRVRWGEDLIVAPDGVEFAASVSRLLVDPDRRAQLSCAGRRFVEGNHDWHAIAEQLSRTYHDAIA